MILNAAKELLSEEGSHSLSTRKIASRIGYSVGTLYNIFQNLEDIYIHINGQTLDTLTSILDAALNDGSGSPIKSIAYAYIKFSRDDFNSWSLLFEYRFQDDIIVPKWYLEKIERIYNIVGSALGRMLKIEDTKELKEHITVLWAGIHGICVLSTKGKLIRAGIQESQVLIDNFIDNYIKGVKA
jgi:AcrR family transcriptional regulator